MKVVSPSDGNLHKTLAPSNTNGTVGTKTCVLDMYNANDILNNNLITNETQARMAPSEHGLQTEGSCVAHKHSPRILL